MIRAVPSRYNVFIDLSEERKLAYNAYSGALVLLDRNDLGAYAKIEADKQLDPKDPVSAELARSGFVVPEQVDELALLEDEYKKTRFDTRHPILTVMTTSACNFGC